MIHGEDEFTGEQVGLLLAFTLRESPLHWVLSLPSHTVHSFERDLIEDTFYHFDPDHLGWKLLQQRRALHESAIDFWQRFHDLLFRALMSQMNFTYLWDRFKYCLEKSARPKRKLDVKHCSTFIDGTTQSHVGAGTVSTDCPPPSHSIVPPSPNDVEDHVCTPVHPSHSPNITPLHFRADLVVSRSSSHVRSFLQPLSSHSGVPPDDVVLCSSIPDSSLVVNEE